MWSHFVVSRLHDENHRVGQISEILLIKELAKKSVNFFSSLTSSLVAEDSAERKLNGIGL